MSKIFKQLVAARGLDGSFLQPKYEDSLDPFLLPDMDKAVARIKRAVKNKEKCIIYGDYDVDGVTASTVMYNTLKLAGLTDIEVMLPNRFTDGYGMSKKVVQRATSERVNLVFTVDCGSRNNEIVDELNKIGVDVIITDHHECGEVLPSAIAVINPKRNDLLFGRIDPLSFSGRGSNASSAAPLRASNSPRTPFQIAASSDSRGKLEEDLERARLELRGLAGVGVAFKLAQALVKEGMIPAGQEKWLLDLVVIGTICDSMELKGENRRLCKYGMLVLEKTRRPGLKELMTKVAVKDLSGDVIGYQIGPRLNAAGRMDTAEKALDLLMTDKRTAAARLSDELEELNRLRKKQQNEAVKEIGERGIGSEPVIVEQGNWHEGVIGIIAGRLVEEYKKPAFVLTNADGELKGSGRSFGDFSLAAALEACKDQIIGGGGHAAACGVRVKLDKLEDFKKAVNEYYQSLKLENQERFLDVKEDLTVEDFDDLSLELIEEMRQLEPFGEGNQVPIFRLKDVRVMEASRLGVDGQHLRLLVWDAAGHYLKVIGFGVPEGYFNIGVGSTVDVWVTLEENVFRGIRSVEGRIVKVAW